MFACSYPIIYLEMNPIQIIIFQLIVVIVLYLSLAFFWIRWSKVFLQNFSNIYLIALKKESCNEEYK